MRFDTVTLAWTLMAANLPTAFAVPKVKSVPIPGGCSAYPDYDASTDTAGPWVVQVVQTGGSPIEGFADTSYDVKFANGSTKSGYITFPSNPQLAKTALRCSSTSTPSLEAYTNDNWLKLQIGPNRQKAVIEYAGPGVTIKTGSPVLPYTLYNNRGQKLDGVYLGGYSTNTTTWAIKYIPKQDYYFVRLFGPKAGPLAKGEFTGFIKILA